MFIYRLRTPFFVSVIALAVAAQVFAQDHRSEAVQKAAGTSKIMIDGEGAVHLPPLVVPFSSFASPEAMRSFLDDSKFQEIYAKAHTIAEQREAFSQYMQPALSRINAL